MKITRENNVIKLRFKSGTVVELPRLNLGALWRGDSDRRLFQLPGSRAAAPRNARDPRPRR